MARGAPRPAPQAVQCAELGSPFHRAPSHPGGGDPGGSGHTWDGGREKKVPVMHAESNLTVLSF